VRAPGGGVLPGSTLINATNSTATWLERMWISLEPNNGQHRVRRGKRTTSKWYKSGAWGGNNVVKKAWVQP
jgi:hypothetical protein